MCDTKEDHMDMPKDHYTSRLDLTTYRLSYLYGSVQNYKHSKMQWYEGE